MSKMIMVFSQDLKFSPLKISWYFIGIYMMISKNSASDRMRKKKWKIMRLCGKKNLLCEKNAELCGSLNNNSLLNQWLLGLSKCFYVVFYETMWLIKTRMRVER